MENLCNVRDYLLSNSYPTGSVGNQKRFIRKQSKGYELKDGKLHKVKTTRKGYKINIVLHVRNIYSFKLLNCHTYQAKMLRWLDAQNINQIYLKNLFMIFSHKLYDLVLKNPNTFNEYRLMSLLLPKDLFVFMESHDYFQPSYKNDKLQYIFLYETNFL